MVTTRQRVTNDEAAELQLQAHIKAQDHFDASSGTRTIGCPGAVVMTPLDLVPV